MRTLTFYLLALCLGGGIGISLASAFFIYSLGRGDTVYWFCVGGLIGGIPAALVGYRRDTRSRNREPAPMVTPTPSAPVTPTVDPPTPAPTSSEPTAPPPNPTELEAVPVEPAGPHKLRRCVDLVAMVLTVVAVIVTVFLTYYFSPAERLDRAMKPFVDANVELLVAYNKAVESGDTAEADDLIAAYELVRQQGLLTARQDRGDGSGNNDTSKSNPVPAASARTQARIIKEFRNRASGETAQKIVTSLSSVRDDKNKTSENHDPWTRQKLYRTAYRLAGGNIARLTNKNRPVTLTGPGTYITTELGMIPLSEYMLMRIVVIELQAVMDGAITISIGGGEVASGNEVAVCNVRYGLNSNNYFQYFTHDSFPRVQQTLGKHLSPTVRQKLSAAQRERNLNYVLTEK